MSSCLELGVHLTNPNDITRVNDVIGGQFEHSKGSGGMVSRVSQHHSRETSVCHLAFNF